LGFSPADHAAYSRLVDARYGVPDPELDWLAGRVQATNTALEEAFIKRILEICARERIDTIFPSSDAWVYVFSKNKALFESENVLIPVPDLQTVMTPLDKYQTICAAQEVGFPCPATFLAESDEDVRRAARELPPPWVIKLRFTTGGRGMDFVEDLDELVEKCRGTRARHGVPMIQEFIPGNQTESLYMVVDRHQRVVSAVAARARRRRNDATASASETIPIGPVEEKAIALGQYTNWWGGLTVQYMRDQRDGQPKLMEINPRLGVHLWYRTELGINEPLTCLKVARDKVTEAHNDYPVGCLFLSPVEDLVLLPLDLLGIAIYRFRTVICKRSTAQRLEFQYSMENRFGCYWKDYRGKRERRLEPYCRYVGENPLPFFMWVLKLGVSLLDRSSRQVWCRLRSVARKVGGAR
jgi:biotin carboxylase